MSQRPQHPSGRPIRRERTVERGYYNVPPDEPLTPGLRRKNSAMAIGFRMPATSVENDDEG